MTDTTKITELKERIMSEFDKIALDSDGTIHMGGSRIVDLKSFLSQALDQIAEETRRQTLEDVMIIIDRYAKENFEEVIISDHKVIKCECGGHLIEWYLCKKFTGYACDKRF